MTRQQTLANAVLESRTLIARYFKGFDDSNHTKQAENLPNHFAWTLGHLALNLHRVAEKLDGRPIPPSDFIQGDGTAGGQTKFDTESVSFGSTPVADPKRYPTYDRCVAIFDDAIERLVSAIRRTDESKLDNLVGWGSGQVKLWTLPLRMVFHNGTHCGQLADLRRALKLKSIFA
jgi:hypothetical protein